MTSRSLVHVDVVPSEAYEQRTRLFKALESAFPVRFQAPDHGNSPPDATLAFVTGELDSTTPKRPMLALVDRPRSAVERFGAIRFHDSALLPKQFRGRTLTDSSTPGSAPPIAHEGWGDVLASCAKGPVWLGRVGMQYAAASWPAELVADEPLRDQLTPGRFMGLLPLTHFLKQLSAEVSWEHPESKACFVFDDPNVHWWSYGFLDYRELAAHAETHDYHVTAASVPFDHWYVHRGTAQFLGQQSRISFAIHGNNHSRHELRRVKDVEHASALAAQALQRSSRLRRASVDVAAVMVPPYGVSSVAMFEGCLVAGFDAFCADWPYWWLTEPGGLSRLSGWQPLDRLRGLPLIPRQHLVASDLDDLVFRAFLGQPLILYAHHTDLRAGLDVLAVRADAVRSLGVDSWQSLGRISRDVVSAHTYGDTMAIILHSRTASVEIPEGISSVQFELSGAGPSETELYLELRDARGLCRARFGEPVPVTAGAIVASISVPAFSPARATWHLRTTARRLLSEARDRALSSRIVAVAGRRG